MVILMFFSYTLAARIIKEQIRSINEGLAAQTRERFDNQILELQSIALEIENASYTKTVLHSPATDFTQSSWAFREMVEYLRVTSATHLFLERIYLVCPWKNTLVANDGTGTWSLFSVPTGMKEHLMHFVKEKMKGGGTKMSGWILDPEKTFHYIHIFSDQGFDSPPFLVSTFRSRHEQSILQTIPSRYGGVQSVLDGVGNVIFSSDPATADSSYPLQLPQKFPTEAAIPSQGSSSILSSEGAAAILPSRYSDLYYYSFIPEGLYLSELNRVRFIFLTVFAAVIAGGAVLLLSFYLLHYRPLQHIIHQMEGNFPASTESGDDYKRLEYYSTRLLTENRINRVQLQQFEHQLAQHYYEQIVRGTIPLKNLPGHMQRLFSPTRQVIFFLICSKIRHPRLASQILPLHLSEMTTHLQAQYRVIRELTIDTIGVALIATEKISTSSQVLVNVLKVFHRKGEQELESGILTVISEPFSHYDDISSHFQQCRNTIEEEAFFSKSSFIGTEKQRKGTFIYLEPDTINALEDAIRDADADKAESIITALHRKLEAQPATRVESGKALFFSSLTTVLHTFSTSPGQAREIPEKIQQVIADFFSATDIDSMKETLLRITGFFCNEIRERRSKRKEQLYQSIKSFIDTHADDSTLYLQSISDHFGIHPKYLGSFFKELHGISPAQYIRELRITNSCRLLEDGLPVKDVAMKSGFTNTISFNRTFKAIMKTTPGNYRRMVRL